MKEELEVLDILGLEGVLETLADEDPDIFLDVVKPIFLDDPEYASLILGELLATDLVDEIEPEELGEELGRRASRRARHRAARRATRTAAGRRSTWSKVRSWFKRKGCDTRRWVGRRSAVIKNWYRRRRGRQPRGYDRAYRRTVERIPREERTIREIPTEAQPAVREGEAPMIPPVPGRPEATVPEAEVPGVPGRPVGIPAFTPPDLMPDMPPYPPLPRIGRKMMERMGVKLPIPEIKPPMGIPGAKK